MGTIICQDCQHVIEHFEGEKVTTLYSTCPTCSSKKQPK
ncbi:GapA-binding peptide SR1P [Oceanobacillus iheyensis]|nr:GapA-binding peptide SR1P [Oceanobacillus iheyensis]